uniref:Folate gamma-glutamyl hydrolase n=1 Tax=Timema monikensis TaxID=170555 RepID=A0A7R9E599_9NEOP|nr:unnamed protein product [Timema monikensis]
MLAYPRIVPGVLVLELSKAMRKELGEDSNRYQSHLPASYVKFVEGSGGRVVPIIVLFPGGAVNFEDADGYAAAGANLLDLATEANQNGDYFPVWGTCLGFQLLTYLAAGRREHRANCYSTQQTLPLEFRTGILQPTEHLYGVLTTTLPSKHFLWSSEQNRYTAAHRAPVWCSNHYSTQQTLPLEFRTGILQPTEHLYGVLTTTLPSRHFLWSSEQNRYTAAHRAPVWCSNHYSTQQTLPLEFRTGILQPTEHLYGVLTTTLPSRHFLWSSEQNRYTAAHRAPVWCSNHYSTQQTLPLEFRTGILQPTEHLYGVLTTLEFRTDFRDSKMFQNAPDHVIEILKTKDVNANFHSYCVTEKNMTKMGLIPDWRILATNHDLNGLEFVSVIESRDFPYYGVIAHPEKNPYEFNPTRNYPHRAGAVMVAQFFANFFVDEGESTF